MFILNAQVAYNAMDKFYLDYVLVLEAIQKFWETPFPLLENLLSNLAQHLHHKFPEITQIQLEVSKKNHFLPKFKGDIGLKFNQIF